MGLVTKPAVYTGSVVTVAQLNELKDTIYDAFGTTANGQGGISDINVAVAAAILRTKIADTSLVSGNAFTPGTQTVTRPTTFAGSLLMTLGTYTTGVEPNVAGVGRARFTYAGVTTVRGFAGGVEGMVLYVLPTNANVTISNNDGAATAGTKIYTNTGANKVQVANYGYTYIYDNAAWHEA